ncbi:MAG: DUF1573 domain-containing protein [Armatimonadetes bacterium]|nr:DUF1573 domain-containing protein [Armatimonadota bacterium]
MLSLIAVLTLHPFAAQGAAKTVAQPPAQAKSQAPPIVAPDLPAGANEYFLRAAVRVEELLSKSDFAGARAALGQLPKTAIKIDWDDSKAPKARRAEFTEARDRALKAWKRAVPDLKWSIGKPADLRFSFEPTLPPNDDTPTPAGAVRFFSESPKDPRIETVLALKRGPKALVCEATDVFNEVGFTLASYYGLSRSLGAGTFTTRIESSSLRPNTVNNREAALTKQVLATVEMLRRAVQTKTPIAVARAEIRVDPMEVRGGEALQGDIVGLSLQVTNVGTAPLRLRVEPDCGCVVAGQPGIVATGGTALVQLKVDTTEFVGELHKKVLLHTNDPERPTVLVPIRMNVKALYRFLSPNGNVALLGANGGLHTVYFIPTPGSGLELEDADISGVEASLTVTPWEGVLADPDMNEPEKPRKGYRIVIDYGAGLPMGRSFSTLIVKTNSATALRKNGDKFEYLNRPIQVQNGILAMPESLNAGEIERSPKRFSFSITRPNSGFKIVRLQSDSPFLTLSAAPTREDWEYRVTVQYDGKSDYGMLRATLTITTDDKRQPKIVVPFRAVVR